MRREKFQDLLVCREPKKIESRCDNCQKLLKQITIKDNLMLLNL